MRRHFIRVIGPLWAIALLASGCDGGGNVDPPTPPASPTPPPPPSNVSPSVTTQPLGAAVTEPAAATFTAAASGTPAPTLQWQSSSDGVTYTNIAGATSETYNTGATTVAQSGRSYRVVATNVAGTANSNSATLTVNPPLTLPSIASQPTSQTVNEPDAATFTVAAVGNPSPTYQWQLSANGTNYSNIAGATNTSYNTGATTSAQSGNRYRAVVSNSVGSVTSDGVQLTVAAAASGATIIYSRNNGTVNVTNYDLYSIRENGGVETPLAQSQGNENFCGVTPAGRVIYQIDVGGQIDIRSVKADGTDTRILASSSDNEFCSYIVRTGAAAGRLIYRRDTATNGRDVYAVNSDGTNPTPLANGPLDEGFAGITENNRVIFGVGSSNDADVYSVDLEGLSVIPLANSSFYETYAGTAAGLVVIGRNFFDQGDLYKVGEAGTGFGALAADGQSDENLAGVTPGGAFVVKSRNLTTNVRTLSANGITLASDADDILYLGSTATHIAYAKYVGNNTDTFSVRIDGTQTATLGNSADSEVVVFLTNDNRAFYERYAITGSTVTLGDVYLINLDGSNRITLAVSADHESFSALVGNRMLYRREIANGVNNIQLWSVNLDGTGNARVLNVGGPSYFSAVTPSGKVLIRNYTGIDNLYVANPDGTGQRLVMGNATFQAVIP